jgi:hypothetical protein
MREKTSVEDIEWMLARSAAFDGGERATLYSPEWQALDRVAMDSSGLMVGPGDHTLLLDAVHRGPGSNLKLELRIRGHPEAVGGG